MNLVFAVVFAMFWNVLKLKECESKRVKRGPFWLRHWSGKCPSPLPCTARLYPPCYAVAWLAMPSSAVAWLVVSFLYSFVGKSAASLVFERRRKREGKAARERESRWSVRREIKGKRQLAARGSERGPRESEKDRERERKSKENKTQGLKKLGCTGVNFDMSLTALKKSGHWH